MSKKHHESTTSSSSSSSSGQEQVVVEVQKPKKHKKKHSSKRPTSGYYYNQPQPAVYYNPQPPPPQKVYQQPVLTEQQSQTFQSINVCLRVTQGIAAIVIGVCCAISWDIAWLGAFFDFDSDSSQMMMGGMNGMGMNGWGGEFGMGGWGMNGWGGSISGLGPVGDGYYNGMYGWNSSQVAFCLLLVFAIISFLISVAFLCSAGFPLTTMIVDIVVLFGWGALGIYVITNSNICDNSSTEGQMMWQMAEMQNGGGMMGGFGGGFGMGGFGMGGFGNTEGFRLQSNISKYCASSYTSAGVSFLLVVLFLVSAIIAFRRRA